MTPIQEDLSARIRSLEKELKIALGDKEKIFKYRWAHGKARFEEAMLAEHGSFKVGLPSYLLQSRLMAFATAPAIYVGIVPFALLDLFLLFFQGICFPVYNVPKVRRADYVIFDRGRLRYLNLLERLNCVYCSYANGLLAYAAEVAARTEQHWCPIKHASRLRAPHSRYSHFVDYGDARSYSEQVERVRDFVDLRSLTNKPPGAR